MTGRKRKVPPVLVKAMLTGDVSGLIKDDEGKRILQRAVEDIAIEVLAEEGFVDCGGGTWRRTADNLRDDSDQKEPQE